MEAAALHSPIDSNRSTTEKKAAPIPQPIGGMTSRRLVLAAGPAPCVANPLSAVNRLWVALPSSVDQPAVEARHETRPRAA